MATTTRAGNKVNGLDMDALAGVMREMKTSPNYFNIARPIRIDARLEVE